MRAIEVCANDFDDEQECDTEEKNESGEETSASAAESKTKKGEKNNFSTLKNPSSEKKSKNK